MVMYIVQQTNSGEIASNQVRTLNWYVKYTRGYLCIHTHKRLWYTDKAYILAKQQGNMCLDLCFLLPWKPPTLQLNIDCQSAALPVRQISENIPFTSFGIDS